MLNARLAQAIQEIDLSTITPEHVLVIKTEIDAYIKNDLKPLIDRLPKGCLVCLIRPGDSIELLNEPMMREAGWMRKPWIKKRPDPSRGEIEPTDLKAAGNGKPVEEEPDRVQKDPRGATAFATVANPEGEPDVSPEFKAAKKSKP